MIRNLLTLLTPHAGRFSPEEAARFGAALTHGCAYIGVGPVVVLFNVPARFRKPNQPRRSISIEELNFHLRTGSPVSN